jgi:hypothetical protein
MEKLYHEKGIHRTEPFTEVLIAAVPPKGWVPMGHVG